MANPLTDRDVEELALLARLELEHDEIASLKTELTDILEYMDALQTLATDEVEPMTHAGGVKLRLRADEAGESLPVDEALAAAPDRVDDYFQVPNIIPSGQKGSGDA